MKGSQENNKEYIRSTCRLCYNGCGILVEMKNGEPFRVKGDPIHPVSKGALCKKGLASLEYLSSGYRLTQPLIRVGSKKNPQWKEIQWDSALELIAERFVDTKKRYGAESIQVIKGGAKGISDVLLKKFADALETPNYTSMASICFVPGEMASRFTYGYYAVPDFDHPPRCIIVWGCNPESSAISIYNDINKAAKKGAKLIVIDPLKSRLAQKADLWLKPRPGTDLPLALAIAHVIIREKLYDRNFVDRWTTGFEQLEKHVRAYTPEKAANITWVDRDKIIEAARLYATNKPGCIQWGNGLETNLNSFQTCRAIAMLRAISGNLAVPGGELRWAQPRTENVFPNPFHHAQANTGDENHERLIYERHQKSLSRNDNLAPFARYVTPPRVVKSVIRKDPYPIRSAFIQGSNILCSYPNSRETFEALKMLEFVVVTDMFMTPTAMMADVVLPAASYLEFDSIEAPCHLPIVSAQQKVASVGESWSDLKILNELAKKLNFKDFWRDERAFLDWVLAPSGLNFEEFKDKGFLEGTKTYMHYEKYGFDTPSGKVELFPAIFQKWGVDPLPVYKELPETPFSDPALSAQYPFIAVSRKSPYFKHSRDRQIPPLRKMHPEPVVIINAAEAQKLGIKDGDIVFVETRRGKIRQKAKLSGDIDKRLIAIDYGWYFPEKKGHQLMGWAASNINILTSNDPPFNKEMGSTNLRGFLCRVSKA